MAGVCGTFGSVLGALQRVSIAAQVGSEGLVAQASRFTALTEAECEAECKKKGCSKRFNDLLNEARLNYK